jgi:hypothetical protein|tara:strand:- start:2090 stop:2395 length:306 start_codon:yes stop_codon:yes gene_type:complete
MSNRCYEPRSAGKVPVKYVFEGNHEKLVTGATYTLKEISLIIGVNDKTMHSRMKQKCVLTDKEVKPTQTPFGGNNSGREGLYDRCEKPDMKLSDKWLRMKL